MLFGSSIPTVLLPGIVAILADSELVFLAISSDRFIILDRGEVVGEFNKDEISREELVQKMIQLHESGKIKVEA